MQQGRLVPKGIEEEKTQYVRTERLNKMDEAPRYLQHKSDGKDIERPPGARRGEKHRKGATHKVTQQ